MKVFYDLKGNQFMLVSRRDGRKINPWRYTWDFWNRRKGEWQTVTWLACSSPRQLGYVYVGEL